MGIAIGPDAARLTMYAGAVLSVLKVNDGAYALAFIHQIEGLVDVFKPHGMGDKGVQRDFTGLSLLDIGR
ncbi:hypothetical protein D3C73_1429060 [compost metagenome]